MEPRRFPFNRESRNSIPLLGLGRGDNDQSDAKSLELSPVDDSFERLWVFRGRQSALDFRRETATFHAFDCYAYRFQPFLEDRNRLKSKAG
jgi:hypothetical protein